MRFLKSPVLIRGVFRELSILGLPVSVSSHGLYETLFVEIHDDGGVNDIENTWIRFVAKQSPVGPVSIKFEIETDLYSATMQPIDGMSEWFELPHQINITNQRTRARSNASDFGREGLIAELRGFGWRRFGLVRDFSERWISALVEQPGIPEQFKNRTAVRVYSESREVFFANCVVEAVRLLGDGYLVVLQTESGHAQKPFDSEPRIHDRKVLESAITVEIQWPDRNGTITAIAVVDCGLGGFKGKILGNSLGTPPVGAIVTILGSEILLRIAWQSGNEIGFDARLNDRLRFNAWLQITSRWKIDPFSTAAPRATTKRIVSSLLRSGYLSGEKARNISQELAKQALIPQDISASRWIRRFGKVEGRQIVEHVSFLRLSDASWLIQELGNASEVRGAGARIIRDGIAELALKEEAYQSISSVLVALYNENLSFNRRFWSERASELGMRETVTYVGSLSKEWFSEVSKINTPPGSIRCVDLSPSVWWSRYSELQNYFSSETLASLGLTTDSYSSPNLLRDLFDSGHMLQRKVALIEDGGNAQGVAVIFGLPTYANLTVSANHLWLVLRSFEQIEQTLVSMWRDLNFSTLMLGVTQLVVLTAENAHVTDINDPWKCRKYRTLSIPFHRLLEFAGRLHR